VKLVLDDYRNKFSVAQEPIVHLMLSKGFSFEDILGCLMESIGEIILEERVKTIDPNDVGVS
jgi:uncharacterized Fe-S cluster-containing protein